MDRYRHKGRIAPLDFEPSQVGRRYLAALAGDIAQPVVVDPSGFLALKKSTPSRKRFMLMCSHSYCVLPITPVLILRSNFLQFSGTSVPSD